MQFYQASMHAAELISVYDKAAKIADEHCGIMAVAHGDPNVGGAGNTASGLSMFMGQQNRGIREVALVVDMNIIAPMVTALYYENYELEDAMEYIGDVKIKAKGSSWLMLREQQALRLNDFLRATANPIDAPLMGLEGRKYGLKEAAKNLHLDASKLIPDNEDMKPLPGMAPQPGEQQVDEAGNPIQGTANRMVPTGPMGG